MNDDELFEVVKRIDASTRAILMLMAQEAKAADPRSKAQQQSPEAVLYLSGFSQAEIGRLLNKTRQSVGDRLKAEGVA